MMREDLTGQQFGRLTVICPAYAVQSPSKDRWLYHWICTCECGYSIVVKHQNLITGNTQSCGCLRNKALYRDPWRWRIYQEKRIAESEYPKGNVIQLCDVGNLKGVIIPKLKGKRVGRKPRKATEPSQSSYEDLPSYDET